MELPVRPGPHGTVLVGPRPAAPAGTGLVLLPGAEAYLDPTAPDDPPFVLVHDAAAAAAALAVLHGEQVADAVATPEPDGDRTVTATPVPDDAAVVAFRRLGLVRWLEQHSPDPLPDVLLDAEFGVAAGTLDDLLAAPEHDEAADRLRRRAGALVRIARRIRDGGPSPAGARALVGEALRRAHDVLPFADPRFDDVRHEVELDDAVRALLPDGRPLDWSALAGLPGLGLRVPVGAGWRDGPVDGGPRRVSVDWVQVPRGVLGTDEDTVTWQLRDGGARVSVSVPALPGVAGDPPLAFRLYTDDRPLPIAAGPLRLDADRTAFVGSAVVHGAATGDLTLDVHDPRTTRGARLGADRTAARATRWAARGVAALRLGAVSAGDDAVEALDEAEHHFGTVAAEHLAAAARTRALRRAARCRAVGDAARDPGDDPEPAEPPVAPVDVRAPDLDGPGWRPLAAETALGVPLDG